MDVQCGKAENTKKGRGDETTGVFSEFRDGENIREVYDSPRARGSSRAKNSSFFGNFRRFWVGIRNTEKVLFVHAFFCNRLVRFVKPREVVASIASCARPVSGYRARVPHRYVPARKRFPLARAVRRPSVDRRPTPAPGMTRFVAEDAFSFSFPATWSASTTNVSASPPRREAGAAAPSITRLLPRKSRGSNFRFSERATFSEPQRSHGYVCVCVEGFFFHAQKLP